MRRGFDAFGRTNSTVQRPLNSSPKFAKPSLRAILHHDFRSSSVRICASIELTFLANPGAKNAGKETSSGASRRSLWPERRAPQTFLQPSHKRPTPRRAFGFL